MRDDTGAGAAYCSKDAKEVLAKVADASRDSIADFSDAVAQMAQAAQDAVRALAEAITSTAAALAESLPDISALFSLENRAMLWASNKHPEWLTIYNRTKKRRIRKKYRDRIMRAYEEALAHE